MASWGYAAETAADGAEALEKVANFRPQVVIADLVMPRMDGMELLGALSGSLGYLSFVMLTAKGTIASAVEAMKQGAFDYLTKPVDTGQLKAVLERATWRPAVLAEVERYKSEVESTGRFGKMVGKSAPMCRLYQQLIQAGPSSASVLLVGESGTGKELVARMLHELSPRNKARSCRSIVRPFRNLSWRVRSSDTKKERSPERKGVGRVVSSWRILELSFSTRSWRWLPQLK